MSAVKHEMFPVMSTSMDAVVQRLEEDEKFKATDLSEDSVNKVIEGLKAKRKMTASQVAYIKGIVSRANAFMKKS